MCDNEVCESGDCEGSTSGDEGEHHCSECGDLVWVDKLDHCDLCETFWCRACFPHGATIEDLIGLPRWEDIENVIGEWSELFCLDCFEKLKLKFN